MDAMVKVTTKANQKESEPHSPKSSYKYYKQISKSTVIQMVKISKELQP
jgi:hypothetical protein